MPDWTKEVQEHLVGIDLAPDTKEEVISELASHLEETYENARSQGTDDITAIALTLQEVEDWSVVFRKIRRARREGSMNHRTKTLWLPSLSTLLGASAGLALFQYLGIRPRLLWVGPWAVTLYWAWLATLPGFGALGALLSRRAEAPVKARLVASLSPALIMLIVMCVILPWGLAIDGFHFFRLVGFGLGLINWVAIPGVALLAGAAPFLRQSRPGLTPQV